MSSTNVAVSIIMPVFNSEKYLQEAIDSVLAQTCRNWELIIIDDGSTDQSGSICDTYVQRDSRIRAVHTENRGVSSARNAGIDLAKGEWIVFMDSDDMMRPRMLEVLLSHSDGVDLVECSFSLIPGGRVSLVTGQAVCYASLQDTIRDVDRLFSGSFYSSLWNKLYRREKITMRLNPQMSLGEDICFNLEYMNVCNRICALPDVLYSYRVSSPGSLTKRILPDFIDNRALVFRQRLRYMGNTPTVQRLASRDFCESLVNNTLVLARSRSYSMREKHAVLRRWATAEFWRSGELCLDTVVNSRHRVIAQLFKYRQVWVVLLLCKLYSTRMSKQDNCRQTAF